MPPDQLTDDDKQLLQANGVPVDMSGRSPQESSALTDDDKALLAQNGVPTTQSWGFNKAKADPRGFLSWLADPTNNPNDTGPKPVEDPSPAKGMSYVGGLLSTGAMDALKRMAGSKVTGQEWHDAVAGDAKSVPEHLQDMGMNKVASYLVGTPAQAIMDPSMSMWGGTSLEKPVAETIAALKSQLSAAVPFGEKMWGAAKSGLGALRDIVTQPNADIAKGPGIASSLDATGNAMFANNQMAKQAEKAMAKFRNSGQIPEGTATQALQDMNLSGSNKDISDQLSEAPKEIGRQIGALLKAAGGTDQHEIAPGFEAAAFKDSLIDKGLTPQDLTDKASAVGMPIEAQGSQADAKEWLDGAKKDAQQAIDEHEEAFSPLIQQKQAMIDEAEKNLKAAEKGAAALKKQAPGSKEVSAVADQMVTAQQQLLAKHQADLDTMTSAKDALRGQLQGHFDNLSDLADVMDTDPYQHVKQLIASDDPAVRARGIDILRRTTGFNDAMDRAESYLMNAGTAAPATHFLNGLIRDIKQGPRTLEQLGNWKTSLQNLAAGSLPMETNAYANYVLPNAQKNIAMEIAGDVGDKMETNIASKVQDMPELANYPDLKNQYMIASRIAQPASNVAQKAMARPAFSALDFGMGGGVLAALASGNVKLAASLAAVEGVKKFGQEMNVNPSFAIKASNAVKGLGSSSLPDSIWRQAAVSSQRNPGQPNTSIHKKLSDYFGGNNQ